jgi:CheY-like chemotaxis protein
MTFPNRVLLVDDDPAVCAALEAVLAHEGYQVTARHSANGVLELVSELAPDVIILDVAMPGVGGVGLSLLLRRKYPAARIILHTGSADGIDLSVAEADLVIPKGTVFAFLSKFRDFMGRA